MALIDDLLEGHIQGLRSEDINAVVDDILHGKVSHDTKTQAVHALIPKDPLDRSTILRVLGAVGVPVIRYKNGTRQKSKTVPQLVQVLLLEWLTAAPVDRRVLCQCFPILFNLLLYEYCRPHIVHLIYLGTQHDASAVRPWHVRLAHDLYHKFPLDAWLRKLLLLFSHVRPEFEFDDYVAPVFEKDTTFFSSPQNKRPRHNPPVLSDPITSLDVLKYQTTALGTPQGILRSRMRQLLVVVGALAGGDVLTKLEYYVLLTILDDNTSSVEMHELFDQVDNFLRLSAGHVKLELVQDFLQGRFSMRSSFEASENTRLRLRLLHHVAPEALESTLDTLIETITPMKPRRKVGCVDLLLRQLQLVVATTSDKPAALNTILPRVYRLLLTTPESLQVQTLLFGLLRLVRTSNVLDLLAPDAVLLPPSLAYKLLFSTNPVVVSEFCGHLAHIKPHRYPPTHTHYQIIQNSYIMDALNFLWRNKAFLQDNVSTGFLLPPDLAPKISTLSTFSFANLVKMSNVGNIFHNPAFALLSADIIWKLEDANDDLTVRHAGPLTEGSVLMLLHDQNLKWLGLSYETARLQVLRQLDTRGFTGLADLLFTSLKTLKGKRTDESEEANVSVDVSMMQGDLPRESIKPTTEPTDL